MATPSGTAGGAPDWDALFDVAQGQAGYFNTRQGAVAGYSPQLLAYLGAKKAVRVRRGIYRLVHFPVSDHADLVVLWLWSERVGVFSHETAVALHDLSDTLPGKVHVPLPASWRRHRFRVPAGLLLHFADIDGGISRHRAGIRARPRHEQRPLHRCRSLRSCARYTGLRRGHPRHAR